jgi:hypothetical protein
MTHRTRIALAALVLVIVAAVLGVCVHRDTAHEPPAEMPAVLQHDSGGLRFTYHVPTGIEGLFDLAADPKMLKNLGPERPADLERLREEMKRKIGVESLEELRRAHRDLIERLRGLGYF